MTNFTHLHVHTQFSLLDGASDIKKLINRVKELGMSSIAITDHGNLYGAKVFHETAKKNGIKPIIGCEVYVARRKLTNKETLEDRSGDHLILLAKNQKGYKNLVKLVSISSIDGFYYRPRIDKELLEKYKEGLIVSSACLGGEIPRALLNANVAVAKQKIMYFKEMFADDFYLELMDHGMPEQAKVNAALKKLSKETGVKLIATNDVHFVKADDAPAHDILVCLSTSKDYNDPNRMRYTGHEYLKSPDEILSIFKDVPEALANTQEIVDKIEDYELNRSILLPEFSIPEGFDNQDEYLNYLTFEGAKKRYPELTPDIVERLNYEMKIISEMGFPGYFLIVQDFIAAARKMGVAVGPGRGSAAGSAVAYCTGITNLDPIKYNLLFERFLNPERVSMPDIDIDFDEDGREEVMKWVVNKYGHDKVAHIITFGTMAAKMAIKDVGRVIQLPLNESNRIAKLVPEKPGTTLEKAFKEVHELDLERSSDNELIRNTLSFAQTLEGCIRHTGIHACGVIIGPEDLTEHIPLTKSNEAELLITQYDGKHIENVGMLKMDFLGLKTLSIIKDAIENIWYSNKIKIDIDNIPFDDKLTFQLYQRGETIGTFQFESSGMRTYLKELKPTNLEDLFAMNALYRPGPMDFIPLFIKRKHGQEKVEYPHSLLEPILRDTYGIMIYQEQIMQAAQIMGGFSLGSADILRRAMGKKKIDAMAEQKEIFIAGAAKKGVDRKKSEEVFDVMAKFASYGFNRSHSAAYSIVAFQTAFLKANYPAEYMAAVLSRNLSDIKKITIFMDECRRMGLSVLGPDVNESFRKFTVNKEGAIRFGMAAIKSVGEGVVTAIINERQENGVFVDIFDFVKRVNVSTVNKRAFEALALAGAFDSFKEIDRYQYFAISGKDGSFIETLIKFGTSVQGQNNGTPNLFGEAKNLAFNLPEIPIAEPWGAMERLNKEKEYIGIYLSAHPLDNYKLEITTLCNATLADFDDMKKFNGKEIRIAGIVSDVEHRTTKTGNPYGSITLEDYTDSYKIVLFSKDYINFKNFFTTGYFLFICGKIQPRFNGSELEFKPTSIKMLSEVGENMVKSIAIKIQLESLTEQFIAELQHLTENYKGNTQLKFLVYEPSTKVWVELSSRNTRVNVNKDFLAALDSNAEIEYKVYTA